MEVDGLASWDGEGRERRLARTVGGTRVVGVALNLVLLVGCGSVDKRDDGIGASRTGDTGVTSAARRRTQTTERENRIVGGAVFKTVLRVAELPYLVTRVPPATMEVAQKRQKERIAKMERMFRDILDDLAGSRVVF